MLGDQLYRIEVNCELSNERLKSLIFFYGTLVGHDALILYEYLVLKGPTMVFDKLNNLLMSLNISVDSFEEQCGKLNEYKLLKTLKQDDKYIFVFMNPLTIREFIEDKLFVRDFILKTSGNHYRELISDIYSNDNHDDFEDVSRKLSLESLNDWSKEDETFLNIKPGEKFEFNTLFDVNVFLRDISTNLLPIRFRTKDNLKQLATLADLYNISYDKMRTFIPKIARPDTNEFDLVQLKYLCINASPDMKYSGNTGYGIPCVSFLMNLQNGKEVTDYDKKIIFNLSNSYHLSPSVINVLLEHTLKNCDNRLIEKYMYSIASDLHRNNATNAAEALALLEKGYTKNTRKDELPTYDTSANPSIDEKRLKEIMEKRNNNG